MQSQLQAEGEVDLRSLVAGNRGSGVFFACADRFAPVFCVPSSPYSFFD